MYSAVCIGDFIFLVRFCFQLVKREECFLLEGPANEVQVVLLGLSRGKDWTGQDGSWDGMGGAESVK